jgi:hypothetical protein
VRDSGPPARQLGVDLAPHSLLDYEVFTSSESDHRITGKREAVADDLDQTQARFRVSVE